MTHQRAKKTSWQKQRSKDGELVPWLAGSTETLLCGVTQLERPGLTREVLSDMGVEIKPVLNSLSP